MALYSIKQETLTDIGDALRRKWGETHEELKYENYAVCKTDGSTGFDNLNTISITAGSGYEIRETYTFKGVAYIVVKMSYYYESGMWFSINEEEILANTDITNIFEKRFDNNEVSFVIYRSNGDSSKLIDYGLYAEIRGYDVDGNLIPYSVTTVQVPNTYKSSEMAQAIDDIPPSLPEEAFVISKDCSYRFAKNGWNWFIQKYGDRIATKDISDASNMFYNNRGITEIPFDLNFRYGGCDVSNMFFQTDLEKIPTIDFNQSTNPNSPAMNCSNLFNDSDNITSIGTIKNLYPKDMEGFFRGCYRLRNIPEFENLKLEYIYKNSYSSLTHFFENCYSLRTIPEDFIKQLYQPYCTGYYYSLFYSGFASCYVLDEIKGLNPQTGQMTSSSLTSTTFHYCYRLKNLIFATQDDGTPYAVKWKSQVISLDGDGHAPSSTFILNYNSGITADKEVTDDASYQLLKNDPDWFTCNVNYSRYNHDSAVATINSLPDTSAYLATAGGTNTIKFEGQAGASTDGGAINTLTEEEIAVAAAKGWTVTLV